jgi:hypothetical protein
MNIYEFLLKRKIKQILKKLKRIKEYHNLTEAQSVLVLFDTKDYDDAKAFIKQLKKTKKTLTIVAYKKLSDENDYSNELQYVVTDKDTKYWKSESLIKITDFFSTKSFDLAVDLTTENNLLLQYVLVSAHSSFKVGFCKNNPPIHDMVITFSPDIEREKLFSVQDLGKQLIHYLTTISSNEKK